MVSVAKIRGHLVVSLTISREKRDAISMVFQASLLMRLRVKLGLVGRLLSRKFTFIGGSSCLVHSVRSNIIRSSVEIRIWLEQILS